MKESMASKVFDCYFAGITLGMLTAAAVILEGPPRLVRPALYALWGFELLGGLPFKMGYKYRPG